MEHAAGLRAQVDQMEGFRSLLDDASTAVELLELEVRFLMIAFRCFTRLTGV